MLIRLWAVVVLDPLEIFWGVIRSQGQAQKGQWQKLVKLLPPFWWPHLLASFPQLPGFGQTGVQGCEPPQLPGAFAQLPATSVPLGNCVVLFLLL